MDKGPQFSDEYTFQHDLAPEGSSVRDHYVGAFHPTDGQIGHIQWKPNAGVIEMIQVNEKHRRKGVATAMYNYAKSLDPNIKMSRVRTPAGDAWRQSMPDEPVYRGD